jgi:mannosylglucosylglycerate synthase
MLGQLFEPALASVQHVVINSYAARQLAIRTGQASFLVPNVMHFEAPPPEPDKTAAELRTVLGVGRGEAMILQPTRIVPRKRIERAIELVRRLEMPASLVISHAGGDEGDDYADYLARYAKMLGVRVLFAAQRVSHARGMTPSGETVYSLADAYQAADLVTYPSNVEGFGNAFLEAIYYCRSIVLRAYDLFEIDIRPKGFRVLAFGEYMPESLVGATRDLLRSPDRVAEMVEHNYAIGRKYYSYAALESCLSVLLTQALGM